MLLASVGAGAIVHHDHHSAGNLVDYRVRALNTFHLSIPQAPDRAGAMVKMANYVDMQMVALWWTGSVARVSILKYLVDKASIWFWIEFEHSQDQEVNGWQLLLRAKTKIQMVIMLLFFIALFYFLQILNGFCSTFLQPPKELVMLLTELYQEAWSRFRHRLLRMDKKHVLLQAATTIKACDDFNQIYAGDLWE